MAKTANDAGMKAAENTEKQTQEALEAKIAELEEALAVKQHEAAQQEEKKAEPVKDAWAEQREIFLPYATKGEEQFVFVAVNGKKYQVPRGRSVTLPLPLYERIQIMLEAEANAVKFRESLPNEAFPTNGEAVRVV